MAKKSSKKHTTSTTLAKKVETVKEVEATVEKTEQQDVEVVEAKDEVVDTKEEKVNIDKEVEAVDAEAETVVEITLQETDGEKAVEELDEPEEDEEPEFTVEELLEATEEIKEYNEETAVEKSVEPSINDSKDKQEVAENNSKFRLYDLVWVTIGLVIGILLSYCIFNLTLSSAINQLAVDVRNESSIVLDENNLSSNNGITTYNDPHTILDKEADIEEAKTLIHSYIKGITAGSTYSQVMVGEEQYIYYMYNSKGEIFTQDASGSYTEVFLTDGSVLKFETDKSVLSVGSDIDVASILRNSVNAIGNKNVTLYEMDLTDSDLAGREFRVDLVGEDAVKLMYSSLGKDFADDMVTSIKESIKDWDPHIIMTFFIGDNTADSYCYCLYVIDNAEYTNWLFQGYDTVEDWTLSDDWYTYDADKDSDGKIYTELITKLVEDIDKVMLSYADYKGWLNTQNTEIQNSTETESKDAAN